MKKTYGILGIALLLSAAVAIAVAEGPSEYWLGIGCTPLSPALRAQLGMPEKQGVLVEEIVPDSPAAKAGIAQHDILLRAGEKPLSEPRDLVAIVDEAKETSVKIELLRGGKPVVVEATPAKRPPEANQWIGAPAPGDREMMENWMRDMWRAEGVRPDGRMRFRVFHPGAILPRDAQLPTALPPNTSITISKEGDQPMKIAVKRGDEKWEITEKELDKLPADLRSHVEQILGHGPMGLVGGLRPLDFVPEINGAEDEQEEPLLDQEGQARRPSMLEQMQKRFDAMDRRMDRLFQQMDELMAGRAQPNTPEKPVETK